MFDFRLKVFYVVAKYLSFTKASQELLISQPAITKHIKEIETKLAIRIFERKGNRISLTPAGKILFEKAKKIFATYKELEYEIGELRKRYTGKLILGASSTISQWVIPVVLSKFKESYPAINISLVNGNSAQIEQALYEERIDLGIVEGNLRRKGLKYSIFKNDLLMPVVSTERNLKDLETITLNQLLKIPLLLREYGSGTLDVILKTLHEKAKISLSDLNVLMHLGSTESIKTYLHHSDAMGIISCAAIKKEVEAGILKTIKIRGIKFKRNFRFVYNQGGPRGLASKFMAFAKRHYNYKL